MSSFITTAFAGALFGAGAGLLSIANGRIAGISGIAAGLVVPRRGDVAWRAVFVLGLLGGGAIAALLLPGAIAFDRPLSLARLIAAGLLIGVGARLANGCTSGHGICGVGRMSPRSLVAVLTFTLAGAMTHALEGALQ